ncbi:MAG: haloacid dehalogenase-like hydrolase, partial [Clostridia bacterium]|nr:haloacid dehalogenase-like hydrolase [Clostridia bacterium]
MKLAIFDFDGTLMKIDSLPYLLSMWTKMGYPRRRQWQIYGLIGVLYVRYKLGLNGRMTTEQMKKTALQKFTRIFTGMNEQQVDEFFDKSVALISDKMNEHVVSEIATVKNLGYHTVLLSGFYDNLLSRIAKEAGIDTVLGTKMHFKDGVIEAKKPMDIKTGTDKVNRILEAFPTADLSTSCA